MDTETTWKPESRTNLGIEREILDLQKRIERDKPKVELLSQSHLAEVATGVPEGEILQTLIARVRKRLGEETDIVFNLSQIGLDIFAKDLSGQKLKVKGGRLVVKEGQAAIEDKQRGKSGGYADEDSLEAVVLLPEGFTRQDYLNWAVTGDPDYLWAFSTAIHEATHQGSNPDRVHRFEKEAMRLALVSTVLALTESASVIVREHYWPRSISKEEWIVLATAYVSSLALGYSSMAVDTFRHAGSSNNNAMARVVNEALAHLSRSDIGANVLWKDSHLVNILTHAHPTYRSNWQAAVKQVGIGVGGEDKLNAMIEGLVDRYAALSGLGVTAFEVNRFLRRKRNVPGSVSDPKAWIGALDKLISDRSTRKHGEPVPLEDLVQVGRLKIEERCVEMRKIFLEEMVRTTADIWTNPKSQKFAFEDKLCLLCPGTDEVRRWAELDYRSGEAALGYVESNFVGVQGQLVHDGNQLEEIASLLVDSFTTSDWENIEGSIRNEVFPQFNNIDFDASGGQLSLAILMEVLKRIFSRWRIDEEMADQLQMWNRFVHDYLNLARDRLNRARTPKHKRASDTDW